MYRVGSIVLAKDILLSRKWETGIVEKQGQIFLDISRCFQTIVYYTVRVMSVEMCRSQISPIFSRKAWYIFRTKYRKEGKVMLGSRIAALRRQAGFSQAELAQRLRISASAVGMYEQGRREPAADLLIALAEVFDVSVDYLLTGRPGTQQELQKADQTVLSSLAELEQKLNRRRTTPFSRQELTVLFAALLMES